MRRCVNAPGLDTGRTLLHRACLAAADRRRRPTPARHSGQPANAARGRGVARERSRSCAWGSSRLRPPFSARELERERQLPGRSCSSASSDSPAPERRTPCSSFSSHGRLVSAWASPGALVPVAVKERLRRPSRRPDRCLHDRHPSWRGAVGRRGGTARRVVRGVAGIARRLFPRDDRARQASGSCSHDTSRPTSAASSVRRACPGVAELPGFSWRCSR